MLRVRAAVFVAFILLFLSSSLAGQEKPATSAVPRSAPPEQSEQQQDDTGLPATPLEVPLIPPKEPSVLGELQIITINSKVYKNIRNLRVWLPAN